MIRVGITGCIGSGKSLVCQVFSHLGVPVYYADLEAKILTDTDAGIRKELIGLMGENIYTGSQVNRQAMAKLIFNNTDLLRRVNRIIHPRVAEHFLTWCANHADIGYIIQESALLFESEAYQLFDRYVVVTSPEEIRLNRVLRREGMTTEIIKSIMHNQLSEEEKVARSHFVIINDEKTLLLPQVLKLHALFADPT